MNELTNLIIDLPNLNSINLGGYALYGNEDDESCSLTMENLPKLTSITSGGNTTRGSFICPRSVTLSNIPNLQTVKLPFPFLFVRTKSIKNVSPILSSLVNYNKFWNLMRHMYSTT